MERTLIVEVSGSQVARTRPRPRPTRPATSGARRSTTGASSAAGATSRSTTHADAGPLLERGHREPVRRQADHRPADLTSARNPCHRAREAQAATDAGRGDHPRRQARQPADRRRPQDFVDAGDREPVAFRYPRPAPRPAARLEGQGRAGLPRTWRATPRRSTSRRRSTRGSWSRTCAAPPADRKTSPSSPSSRPSTASANSTSSTSTGTRPTGPTA